MTRCIFAFGEGGSYFMESPTKWNMAALPDAMRARFPNAGEDAKGSKVAYVYDLVLGTNSSYMLAWKGTDGKDYEVNHGLPENLAAWLSKKNDKGFLVRDVKNLKLALGPGNKSWFVTDGKSYLWNNLPTQLNTAIENLRKGGGGFSSAPRLVALGVENTYVMATAAGGSSWNVQNQYPQLDAYLKGLQAGTDGKTFGTVSYVSLNAFNSTYFVIAHKTGRYYCQAPTEWQPKVVEVLKTLPVEAAKALTVAQNSPHQAQTNSWTDNGGKSKYAKMALNSFLVGASGGTIGGDGLDGTPSVAKLTENLVLTTVKLLSS